MLIEYPKTEHTLICGDLHEHVGVDMEGHSEEQQGKLNREGKQFYNRLLGGTKFVGSGSYI